MMRIPVNHTDRGRHVIWFRVGRADFRISELWIQCAAVVQGEFVLGHISCHKFDLKLILRQEVYDNGLESELNPQQNLLYYE